MTQLSNRQYPMLKAFVETDYMTIETAQLYDQRPFRSMLLRGWITYHPKRGFHITDAGQKAWREFRSTEIWRLHPSRPLTAYFDPTAYHLPMPRRRASVHVMKAGAA
jgi:hypothetical protein